MVNLTQSIKILKMCDKGITAYKLAKLMDRDYFNTLLHIKILQDRKYIKKFKKDSPKELLLTAKGEKILISLEEDIELKLFLNIENIRLKDKLKDPIKEVKTKKKKVNKTKGDKNE